MIQERNKLFSYKNCRFALEKEKENTARIVLFKELGIINCYTLEASFYGAECLGKVVYEEAESSSDELEPQIGDQEELDDEEADDEEEEEEDEDEDEPEESKQIFEGLQKDHINIVQNPQKAIDEDQLFFQEACDNDDDDNSKTHDVGDSNDDNKITLSLKDDSFKVSNTAKDTINEEENKETSQSRNNDENQKSSGNSPNENKIKSKNSIVEPAASQKQDNADVAQENPAKK